MKKGFLSNYFKGIAVKYLSAVEAYPETSNQHEFNGISSLKVLLGESKHVFPAKLYYVGTDDNDIMSSDISLTWYDARKNHPVRSEYRLYFQPNPVLEQASAGDLLIIGITSDDSLSVVIVKANTSFESQLLWLFGLTESIGGTFEVKKIEQDNDPSLNFASRYILNELGIEIKEDAVEFLDKLIARFNNTFPTTREFSNFARETYAEIDVAKEPDKTLVELINHEEMLFRTFERHIVAQRLRDGFDENVDEFISFSLSVQNRRKSRAGYALENHLEYIFQTLDIHYSRNGITENKTKPDFIFPNISCYHDQNFSENALTMLGVKSTCKERWRQVLSEAARINRKHLFTLEPAISKNQTDEMVFNNLQLVIPQSLHNTYRIAQQKWLIDLSNFIEVVQERQKKSNCLE